MKWLLLAPIYLYRYGVSPLLPPTCRFEPSCSAYAIEAIRKHGIIHGSRLTIKRISTCHPWGKCGFDPVPHHPTKKENL